MACGKQKQGDWTEEQALQADHVQFKYILIKETKTYWEVSQATVYRGKQSKQANKIKEVKFPNPQNR